MTDDIAIQRRDGILEIRLARPEKKNALTEAMYAAMAEALEEAETDGDVRALLVLGSEGCFTAGNDLKDFLERPPDRRSAQVFRFVTALARSTVPLIAAVDGVAIGIGTTLLLHCDYVLASPEAVFRMPFVDLGLLPEAGSSYLLPRLVGHAKAAELVLWARPFGAETARELGLVNAVSPAGELEAQGREAAREVAAKPPAAVRRAKALLKWDRLAVEERIDTEAQEFVERLDSAELKEAVNAFLEKRKPDFSGRG